MGYITESYYNDTYKGEATTGDLAALIERASDVIDTITNYKIPDISEISSEFIKNQIMKATAAEVEYMDRNGGLDDDNSDSVSLGKFSYNSSTGGKSNISKQAISYLEPTGYLYRGL